MRNHIAELKELNREDFYDEANLYHLRRIAHDNPLALAIIEAIIDHGVPSIPVDDEDEVAFMRAAYRSVAGEDFWADETDILADAIDILRGKRATKDMKQAIADELSQCIEKMEGCMKEAAHILR
jgi:hypothetical protein